MAHFGKDNFLNGAGPPTLKMANGEFDQNNNNVAR